MRFVRPFLVLALFAALGLLLPANLQGKPRTTAQRAAKQKKKHHHHNGFSGTVVHVHHNKQKRGHGTIKVQVHHRSTRQNAGKAQAAPVRRKRTGATAIVRKHKNHHHLVTIRVTPQTQFAVVATGLVPGKTTIKTVGSGKKKTRIAVAGKPRMATQQHPAGFAYVHKGQHVRIHRHVKPPHHATAVHIIHASAQKQSTKVAGKQGKR